MKKLFLVLMISAVCLTAGADTLAEVDSLLKVYDQSKGESRRAVGQELMKIYSDFQLFFHEPPSIDKGMSARSQDFVVWYSTERFYNSCAHFAEALEYNDRALALIAGIVLPDTPPDEPTAEQDHYATLLCDQSYCLYKTSDYARAIEKANLAASVSQKTANHLQLARAYLYMALVNHALQNHDEATRQVEKAIETNEQAGDNSQLHNTLGVACEIFCSAKQLDKAVGYGLQAVKVAREMNFLPGVANHLMQLSYVYDRKGDYQQGIKAADEAIAIIMGIEPLDRNQLALSLEYKSWNLIDMGRHKEAAETLREAMRLETELGNTHAVWNNYRTLSEALEPIDPKGAIDALKLYTRMGDSIHSKQLQELMTQANAKFHNDELREQNEQSQRTNRIITWTAVAVVLMLVVVIASLWFAFRQKKRSNQALQRLTVARETFFTNVTHEFRTPLTVILGLGNELTHLEGPTAQMGQSIVRQGQQLLTLVNQMLDISKVKSALGEHPQTVGDLSAYVAMVVERYQEMARQKGVTINYVTDEDGIETAYVADYVEKLAGNLLSNAIKFTPQGGWVDISLLQQGDALLLTVSDTGKGIAPEHLPHIFEPFYKGDDSDGTGVGLVLVKQIVDEMNGEITVESHVGGGTTFRVKARPQPIPKGEAHSAPSPQGRLPQPEPLCDEAEEEASGASDRGVSILIVEDNADVASLISLQLHGRYDVSFATDGKEGIEKARATVPDLIITDLMMPRTDGLQLCRAIRADKVTSHIPIIVVTAKATEADRIKGLQAGADAYLYKPFNADELRVRVEKLLEKRAVLQQKLNTVNETEAAPPEARNADAEETPFTGPSEQFVERVKQVVMDLIAAKQCDVEHVAAMLYLSQFQLRSKLSAIVGLTPKKYILSLQLEYARQMIKEHPDRLITDVADRCGFYDKSHFTRQFRDAYGMTPGEYARQFLKE